MNNTFSISYIIPPLEYKFDYIVLNYCLLETTSFTDTEDNFIRVTSLRDGRLTARNITTQLNQCREKVSTSTMRKRLCESKFEIFDSNKWVYTQRRVGERAATPCITPNVKQRADSDMVLGGRICTT